MDHTAPERIGPATRHLRHTGWITLILLAAAALRLFADIPPGMTHDEADHGLTAWEIVNGARALYFTVGYGREPLYDYATALLMAGTGPTILAARLTSVYFSLIMIAATYAWARRAFGRPVGLLTAAGLAAGFWPLMAARQALRSIALPALFSLAVLVYWRGLFASRPGRRGEREKGSTPSPLLPFAAAGILLGLTLYTYIPARVMWLAWPALAGYLALAAPGERRRIFVGTGLTLLVAAVVAAPLFVFLANNPGLEARINELSAPLRAAAGGDLAPLWANARGALRLFTVEGDQTWRYNIPGKPLLGPVMGVLFYVGLLVAGWLAVRGLRNPVSSEKPGFYGATLAPGAFLALVWLALGFAPVLVTGPGLSMTQAIGAQPAVYLFPALALVAGYEAVRLTADRRRPTAGPITNYELRITNSENATRHLLPVTRHSYGGRRSAVGGLLALAFFAAVTALTARAYFGRWANAPEVRVQYESTMVAALRYLDERGRGAAAVSTITPGRYHTPAVALLTLHNPAVRPRWFDGRQSLILPGESDSLLLVPGFTPIPAALQPYLAGATLVDELPMRPDDLDRPVSVYALDGLAAIEEAVERTIDRRRPTARFGEHVELLGYELSATAAAPGETLTLVTVWRLLTPLPEASLFAHLVGPGEPLAVADGLGAPGEAWLNGDVLIQLHALTIPPDAPPGDYPLAVGVYTRDDRRRLTTGDGQDMVTLETVKVGDE